MVVIIVSVVQVVGGGGIEASIYIHGSFFLINGFLKNYLLVLTY